jgi:protein SCO1/2
LSGRSGRLAGACLAAALLACGARAGAGGPGGVTADSRPTALREVGFDQELGARLPADLVFRDEAGRSVRLGDYLGKRPVLLTLVYYDCPMLCTLTLNGLAGALSALAFDVGREFEVLTVSFDPSETPALAAAKKAAYLRRYARPGAEAGWHFLTGDAGSTAALARAVGFRYAWDPETRQYAHPAGVIVLTPEGRIARYLFGVEYAPRDLRLGLVEASAGRIGTPIDELILYCYQYDPARGRYGASVMGMLRAGGVLTLAALGAFVSVSLLRERALRRGAAKAR